MLNDNEPTDNSRFSSLRGNGGFGSHQLFGFGSDFHGRFLTIRLPRGVRGSRRHVLFVHANDQPPRHDGSRGFALGLRVVQLFDRRRRRGGAGDFGGARRSISNIRGAFLLLFRVSVCRLRSAFLLRLDQ